MSERIKPTISGSAETMLQSFYARAQYSKSKNNKFYDAKAVELVDRIDYDFSTASRDSTMGKGVIARNDSNPQSDFRGIRTCFYDRNFCT